MRRRTVVKRVINAACVALAALSVSLAQWTPSLAQSTLSAVPTSAAPAAVADVALGNGGVLYGRVVDRRGAPVSGTPVSLWYQQQQVAKGKTDSNGDFRFRQVRGGVHYVAAAQNIGMYRLWDPGTAPPMTQQTALVVGNGYSYTPPPAAPMPGVPFFRRPAVVGGIAGGLVAAAVSVPVSLLVDNDDAPPASP